MPDISDPLIQGMMAGLRFKEVFQNAKRQREELDMRKQALAEARAQHERQNELMDLQQRIEMNNAGFRPVTQEDTFRSSLRDAPRFRADESGGMTQIGSGVSGSDVGDRMLNYRGEQFVMPSEQEKQQRLANALKAKAYADIAAKEGAREKFGQSFELEPGVATTVLPSEIPANIARRAQIEQSRAAAEASNALTEYRRRPAAPKQLPVAWKSDAKGNLIGVTLDATGKPVVTPVPGVMASPPKGTTGGEGSASLLRLKWQMEQDKQKKLTEALNKEQDVHDERISVGNSKTLTPEAKVKRLTEAANKLQEIQFSKATILGAKRPPKEAVDAVAEGESRDSPDGHVWMKKDGVLYIVK